jgi:hypothetical protein
MKKIDTLELLLVSGGGHPDVAYKVVRFFQNHCNRLNVLVPLYAKSAATLMCLGAQAIYMGEWGELGPIDVQIPDPIERGDRPVSPLDEFKSMEFLKEHAVELLDYFSSELESRGMSVKEALEASMPCVVGMMRPLYEGIDPIVMGEHRRSLAVGEQYADRLLRGLRNAHRVEIVERLIWGYPSHGFVIDRAEAKALGLPVVKLSEAEDRLLREAVLEVVDHDTSYRGFVDGHRAKPATKPKRSKRSSKRSVPTPTGKKPPASAVA